MNTRDVIRLYLKEDQPRGSNANRTLFFEGTLLYSYSLECLLAHRVNGVTLVMLHPPTHTTAAHRSHLLLLSDGAAVCLPKLVPTCKDHHRRNLSFLHDEMNWTYEKGMEADSMKQARWWQARHMLRVRDTQAYMEKVYPGRSENRLHAACWQQQQARLGNRIDAWA